MTSDAYSEISPDAGGMGLYVHVPFCGSKCRYCDFCSRVPKPGEMDRYIRALAVEIQMRATLQPIRTIYIGGGTPSFLDSESLCGVIESLRDVFPVQAGCEITVEANPADVTSDWLEDCQEVGVNRLSLGVQGMRDEDLQFLGRRHTVADALAAAQRARVAGFENLSIDMIVGLPSHTAEMTGDILTEAVGKFAPEHVSAYQLTCAEGTPLHDAVERGDVRMPDEDAQACIFMATHQTLEDLGYEGYEVSNFARTRALRSRHNTAYWTHKNYMGFGPSAHSFVDPVRSWNTPDISRYCERLEKGALPVRGEEKLDDIQRASEIILLGLRMRDGFSMATLQSDCGIDLLSQKADALLHGKSEGYLVLEGDRVKPTLQGMAIADGLAVHLSP